MLRIGVVGTGYVGLVSGTCFAEFGIDVICCDNNAEKINRLNQGRIPIYEPGLDDLVAKQVAAGRLHFTTDLAKATRDADAVFIAVGTPPRAEDGQADLTYVFEAAREIARNLSGYTVVVTKSTVPVGTARRIKDAIRAEAPHADFDVVSNPEFLREGAAINDFMRPDRVIIGVETDRATDLMRQLYRPLNLNEVPMVLTSLESAEIIKYASNAFLATKITFINQIADLCEMAGANVQDVARGMGLDGRIGSKFLHAGPGYGGSCFPKDTLALTHTGRALGAPQTIVETVVEVNAQRQRAMADRIIHACDGDVRDKKIGILGVAFKPNTDDIREAPALVIIPRLQQAGARITAHDPAAMEHAAQALSDVEWVGNVMDVADGADALVILTEWNEFRGLNFDRLGQIMRTKRLIDLRNIYKPPAMVETQFHYVSIGRDAVKPAVTGPQRLKAVSG